MKTKRIAVNDKHLGIKYSQQKNNNPTTLELSWCGLLTCINSQVNKQKHTLTVKPPVIILTLMNIQSCFTTAVLGRSVGSCGSHPHITKCCWLYRLEQDQVEVVRKCVLKYYYFPVCSVFTFLGDLKFLLNYISVLYLLLHSVFPFKKLL